MEEPQATTMHNYILTVGTKPSTARWSQEALRIHCITAAPDVHIKIDKFDDATLKDHRLAPNQDVIFKMKNNYRLSAVSKDTEGALLHISIEAI